MVHGPGRTPGGYRPDLGNGGSSGVGGLGGLGPTRTSDTTGVRRSSGTSGYDGLTSRGRDDVRTHRTGDAGSEASAGGYGFLTKLHGAVAGASGSVKRAVTMGALGFMLLFPPIVGQFMHPGLAQQTVKSPVAMQMMQKAEVKTGSQIKQEMAGAVAQVPAQTGATREAALGQVIKVSEGAAQQARSADKLVSDASKQMDALRAEVGLDAKMGYVVDLYWFGVPDQHMAFHQGGDDTKALTALDRDIHQAANEVRSTARNEVSKLLYQESPSFKTTKDRYDVVHAQYTAAQTIQEKAGDAYDALSTAQNFVMLRNATPKTVTVDDYTTKTVTNADGTTSQEQVRTGSHEESNPTWDSYNLMAIAAKASAEGKVKEMNGAITASRALFPESQLNGVDVNLIGVLDFFGHPSFLVWSFDSHDVSQAMSKVGELKGAAGQLVRSIAPEHQRLDGSIQRSIDMRWDGLRSATAPLG